MIKQMC